MRIAYLGLDEVNGALVQRWAARQGVQTQVVALPDSAAVDPRTAVVLDLDHLPEPWRKQWLARLLTGRPALAFGYNLSDAEALALQWVGATVVRRRLRLRHVVEWLRRTAVAPPDHNGDGGVAHSHDMNVPAQPERA
jgi:hypothetical protein